MSQAAIQIESMEFDAAVGGWFVQARRLGPAAPLPPGPHFVKLGFYATADQIRTALVAKYS